MNITQLIPMKGPDDEDSMRFFNQVTIPEMESAYNYLVSEWYNENISEETTNILHNVGMVVGFISSRALDNTSNHEFLQSAAAMVAGMINAVYHIGYRDGEDAAYRKHNEMEREER